MMVAQEKLVFAAPAFCLGIVIEGEVLAKLDFLPPQKESAGASPLAREVIRQLRAWLADAKFAFDLPLKAQGTNFQRRVWAQIAAIPPGQTRTYGELAQVLNTGPRAVGQACGANPVPIVVPCHRVIAAKGRLGGFAHHGGGFLLEVKRWLLAHEQGG
ncbi:MAG: Methylated-DNA--protein-cysteine methyltransferase [Betaproteobacteria bacterium ADurb.Bin341]|nr:MAG: Methylated-DNA--protein-cysteine methyltransferase [Betaproteobacteria bacterium ADurb.Bin341]